MAKKTRKASARPSKRKASKAPTRSKAARRVPAKPRCRALSPRELDLLIQKTAYELYARRGYIHGRDWADWLEAERIVLSKNR